MNKVKSLSDKRLLVSGTVNGSTANFLLDTGASVGILNESRMKRYGLKKGRRFSGTLIGGGGDMSISYMCDTPIMVGDRPITQFLLGDIESVVESIKRQTGIEILGIIGLPQMKTAHISLDIDDSLIIFE